MSIKLSKMLAKFGNVTVMDAEFYEPVKDENGIWSSLLTFSNYDEIEEAWVPKTPIVKLDTLKISNIMQEGPRKTATGGQNADILIKYGKSMRIEMQDALGSYNVLTKLYGVEVGIEAEEENGILTVTDLFAGPKTIVGTTFFIDQDTGAKQPVKIVIPYFLPDSIFNIEGDAEGDVGTFDINGDIIGFYAKGAGEDDITEEGLYKKGGDIQYYMVMTKTAFTKMQTIENYPDPESVPEEEE